MKIPLTLRYLIVGGLNTVIGFAAILFCLKVMSLPPVLANACGFATGFLVSFFMHREFTFQSNVGLQKGIARFGISIALGYLANLGVLLAVEKVLPDSPVLAQVCALVAYLAVTYALAKGFVFRGTVGGASK
jgi:putative flippase GtrA